MRKTTEWYNVEMELVIELTPELIDTMKPELQSALNPLLPPDWIEEVPIELHIEFKSSGYSDPGRWGSCPDDSQAPEGEDERTMDAVYLMTQIHERAEFPNDPLPAWLPENAIAMVWHDDKRIELPRALQESLFAHFQKYVDEEELPETESDYDDQ